MRPDRFSFRLRLPGAGAVMALLVPLLTFLALPLPAQAQQVNTIASYVVTIAGVNVAYVNVRLDVAGANYQLDLSADVTGLAQMVAEGSGSVNSGGVVTQGGLASNRFYLETRTAADRFSVQAQFSGGNATGFAVDPPPANDAARVPVTASHTRAVNDPLAAFILRGETLSGQLCQRQLPIFTGLERFDVGLSYAEMQEATSTRTGYQGPVVLCQMDYRPIAGHFPESEITRYLEGSNRMLVWFAPLRDSGFFIPYRVLIGTNFGDISMVLTRLE